MSRHKREAHPLVKRAIWFLILCLLLELIVGCALLFQPIGGK